MMLFIISVWGVLKMNLFYSVKYGLSFMISFGTLIVLVLIHLILSHKLRTISEKVVIDVTGEKKTLIKTSFYALSEEIIFRGVITMIMACMFGPAFGIVFGALLFAMIHAHRDKYTVIYSLLMGIGLGTGIVFTNDIVFPILAHIAFNILGGVIKTVPKEAK